MATAISYDVALTDDCPDRHAMSWDALRHLDQAHVVASLTRSHCQVSLNDPNHLRDEIEAAQQDFIRHLGHPARSFA